MTAETKGVGTASSSTAESQPCLSRLKYDMNGQLDRDPLLLSIHDELPDSPSMSYQRPPS
jgi:hypothetical protein